MNALLGKLNNKGKQEFEENLRPKYQKENLKKLLYKSLDAHDGILEKKLFTFIEDRDKLSHGIYKYIASLAEKDELKEDLYKMIEAHFFNEMSPEKKIKRTFQWQDNENGR